MSVDVLFDNGTYFCGLPDLPDIRYLHTQNGFVTCGGRDSSFTMKSCLTFVDGEWQQSHYPLLENRYAFSSWETDLGTESANSQFSEFFGVYGWIRYEINEIFKKERVG